MATKTSRNERRQAALHRRRQEAARRTAAARRANARRTRLKVLAAVVAVAVAITGVTVLVRSLGDDDDGPSAELRAEVVDGATGALGVSESPSAYRAVYRAESYQESDVTVSTEDVAIQRPYQGRVAILEGAPPGGAARFEGRSDFAEYANYTDAGAVQVAGDAPTVALGDVRVGTSLDELVRQGLFVQGERRRARLGTGTRECQTYRTGSPLQSLKITAPTATDYVDVCLDRAGLILEELTVAAGKPTQRLTATSLDLDARLEPALFEIDGTRVGPDQGGAEVTEIDRTVSPAPGYWAPTAAPAGFEHRGRYQVVGEGTSWVDLYVRGIDLVSIRQGAPAAEPDLSDAGPGSDVDLGPLGAGKMLLRTIGPTAIAHPAGEAFVHVAGTLGPEDLRAIAAGLRRT